MNSRYLQFVVLKVAVLMCGIFTFAHAQVPVAAPATATAAPAVAKPTVPPTAPAPGPVFAPADLSKNGVRSMAATCAACHGTNGVSVGGALAGLAGLNKEYFVLQMKNFREGKREATLMHQISKGYSEAETNALADYFAAQKR